MGNAGEYIRRFIKRFLGSNSIPYKLGSSVIVFWIVTWREGFRAYRLLRNCSSTSMQLQPISLKLRSLDFPISFRPGGDNVTIMNDAALLINTVIRREYGKIQPSDDPIWMIDAGAYIGDTAAFFLSRYPGLNIIALEQWEEPYNMAIENLKPYGERVILLKKALWGSETTMRVGGDSTDASSRDYGFEVNCTTIPALMRQYSIDRLDILKIDIEGAELNVFASEAERWLHLVDLIIIEIREDSTLRIISDILRNNGFFMTQYRSVWYCQRSK